MKTYVFQLKRRPYQLVYQVHYEIIYSYTDKTQPSLRHLGPVFLLFSYTLSWLQISWKLWRYSLGNFVPMRMTIWCFKPLSTILKSYRDDGGVDDERLCAMKCRKVSHERNSVFSGIWTQDLIFWSHFCTKIYLVGTILVISRWWRGSVEWSTVHSWVELCLHRDSNAGPRVPKSLLHQNIFCGYSLELSQWDNSNEYPQDIFRCKSLKLSSE